MSACSHNATCWLHTPSCHALRTKRWTEGSLHNIRKDGQQPCLTLRLGRLLAWKHAIQIRYCLNQKRRQNNAHSFSCNYNHKNVTETEDGIDCQKGFLNLEEFLHSFSVCELHSELYLALHKEQQEPQPCLRLTESTMLERGNTPCKIWYYCLRRPI